MDTGIIKDIRRNLNGKSTDELLQIWKENDREAWSDSAFEAVKQILIERGAKLPPQNVSKVSNPEVSASIQRSAYRKSARLFTILVGLWWIIDIARVIYELTISHSESINLMTKLLPLYGPGAALLVTFFWFMELGSKKLRQNPPVLALGLICAVALFVSVAFAVQVLSRIAILHERIDGIAYAIGTLVPILILGFLSYRLSFEHSKD